MTFFLMTFFLTGLNLYSLLYLNMYVCMHAFLCVHVCMDVCVDVWMDVYSTQVVYTVPYCKYVSFRNTQSCRHIGKMSLGRMPFVKKARRL